MAAPALGQYPPTPGTGRFSTIESLEYANVDGHALLLDHLSDFHGPTDLLKLDKQKLPCLPLDGNSPFMPALTVDGLLHPAVEGADDHGQSDDVRHTDDPPFLILHGLLDCLVSFQQSVALHQALEARGLDSTLMLLADGEHGGSAFDELKNKQLISDWLDKHLRGPMVPLRRRTVVGEPALR